MRRREPLAQSGSSVVKTVPSGKLGIVLVEGNAPAIAMDQVFEVSGGNSGQEDNGIQWLQ